MISSGESTFGSSRDSDSNFIDLDYSNFGQSVQSTLKKTHHLCIQILPETWIPWIPWETPGGNPQVHSGLAESKQDMARPQWF
jgi:hypothetical protein